MLGLLTTVFTLGIVFLNLIGLALAGHRATGSYILSRAVSPAAAALVFFFCEHVIGFGHLNWVWPITTIVSMWIVRHDWHVLRQHWKLEALFLLAFAWVFVWRFLFPGIVGTSEKLSNLAMISSYLPGERLPPVDVWLPPFPFDVYYSFQFYAAALLGRVFDLGPGWAYNISFCLLVALTITCAAVFAYTVCRTVPGAALVTVAFAAGGTGATVPVQFMLSDAQLHSSMRFIGGTATHQHVQTQFGRSLLDLAGVPKTAVDDLPSETFAYLTSLGDYHPPLSGFYLLMVAMLCLALIESGAETRFSQAVLAASVVVCAVANGWSLPLQVVLVLTWVAFRLRDHRSPDWWMLASGFLLAAALCYPFLRHFAYRSADYGVALKLVPVNQHTPILLGIILLYPVLVGVALPLVFGERQRWTVWSLVMWLGLLACSELFYVDDVYSGTFNRFNTTLKWWPWIQAGGLLAAGAYGIGSKSRTCRYGTFAVLTVVSLYAIDMVRVLALRTKTDVGRLDGAAWITDDKIENVILEFLKAQPRGIVLQRLEAGAFTSAPGLVVFAGHKAFLGWPAHEKLWRGQRADIDVRGLEVAKFYAGDMPESTEWLLQNRIDHVLWLKTEAKLPSGTFDKIDEKIRSTYFWREYYRTGEFRVGLWSRKILGTTDRAADVSAR